MQVSRCQSFAERAQAQPLPLPRMHHANVCVVGSGNEAGVKPEARKGTKAFLLAPLPKRAGSPYGPDPLDAEAAVGTNSVSSDISTDSDDPSDSHLPSPHASDYEIRSRTATASPSRCVLHAVIVRLLLRLLCSPYMFSCLNLCLLR